MIKKISLLLCLSFWVASSQSAPISGQGTWETTLLPRSLDGDNTTAEAYYDTVLDITWLGDANYADANKMEWGAANAWAAGLNPYSSGIMGWRLPMMVETGASSGCLGGIFEHYNGEDCGYNVKTTSGSPPYPADTVYSEMASMYYDTLGNLAVMDTSGDSPQPGWGLTNTGPFDNLQNNAYWTGSEKSPCCFPYNDYSAWYFKFTGGSQYFLPKEDYTGLYVWAVHDGDVGTSVIPIPAAVWLFSSGLLGLIGVARKRVK